MNGHEDPCSRCGRMTLGSSRDLATDPEVPRCWPCFHADEIRMVNAGIWLNDPDRKPIAWLAEERVTITAEAPTAATASQPVAPRTKGAPKLRDILAAIDALGPSSRDAITDYIGASRAVVLDLVTEALRYRLVHFTSDGYALTVDGRFRHNLNLSKASKR